MRAKAVGNAAVASIYAAESIDYTRAKGVMIYHRGELYTTLGT